jgi:hypothetical protein
MKTTWNTRIAFILSVIVRVHSTLSIQVRWQTAQTKASDVVVLQPTFHMISHSIPIIKAFVASSTILYEMVYAPV